MNGRISNKMNGRISNKMNGRISNKMNGLSRGMSGRIVERLAE